jgi:hypothetical protein
MSGEITPQLLHFCVTSLARPVPSGIHDIARQIAASHKNVAAILAYGSCLRGTALNETLIDFYVLTHDLSGVSSSMFARWGCALLPPNVHYIEHKSDAGLLRAKYAVLPLAQFRAWMGRETSNPYFWARFCQPSALVQVSGESARQQVVEAVATAITTFIANARGISGSCDALALWTDGFRATYATELRSERQDRAQKIVAAYPGYYREAHALAVDITPLHANWKLRGVAGKLLSILRLMKASFTFKGGADYLAWKIERHSGVKVELTGWQRRHPLLAGPLLLLRLRRKGAVR